MWTATFVEEEGVSMVPLNGSPYGRREDRVGTPSESSHIATERKFVVPGKQLKFCVLRYDT